MSSDKKFSIKYEPLHLVKAIRKNDIVSVKGILESGVDVNIESNSQTSLYCAISNNYLEMTEYLLQEGADVNYGCSNSLRQPLIVAAQVPNLDLLPIMQILLKVRGININCTDAYGAGALYYALRNFNIAMATLLLDHNVDINMGSNPVNIADSCFEKTSEGSFAVMELLLQRGCTYENLYYYKICTLLLFDYALKKNDKNLINFIANSEWYDFSNTHVSLIEETSQVCKSICKNKFEFCNGPLSLKGIVMIFIRKRLAYRHGNLKKEYIDILPLPKAIKNYLWLGN